MKTARDRVHKTRDTESKGEQRPNARASPGHSPGPVLLSHSRALTRSRRAWCPTPNRAGSPAGSPRTS